MWHSLVCRTCRTVSNLPDHANSVLLRVNAAPSFPVDFPSPPNSLLWTTGLLYIRLSTLMMLNEPLLARRNLKTRLPLQARPPCCSWSACCTAALPPGVPTLRSCLPGVSRAAPTRAPAARRPSWLPCSPAQKASAQLQVRG